MPSPPKPWENNNNSNNIGISGLNSSIGTDSSNGLRSGMRMASLERDSSSVNDFNSGQDNTMPNNTSSGYGTINSNYNSSYGMNSSYGTGYNSGYGSRFGLGYGSGYNSMGLGSTFGRMGGYGGYNSYGGGGFGQPYSLTGMPMGQQPFGQPSMGQQVPGEPSLMDQVAQTSQPTFQLLERIVGSFGSVAQMLESTFFATHSSFMAIIGVAEQFGLLKHMISSIFSFFSVFRWVRNFLYKVRGKRPPIDPAELSVTEFNKFTDTPKYSYRPFLIFFGLVFGFPYLLHLLLRSTTRRLTAHDKKSKKDSQNNDTSSTFEFAQAIKDFSSRNTGEISFVEGDLIAVLDKEVPPTTSYDGNSKLKWWRGRLRDGIVGVFPSSHVDILEPKNHPTSSEFNFNSSQNISTSSGDYLSDPITSKSSSYTTNQKYHPTPSYKPYQSQNYGYRSSALPYSSSSQAYASFHNTTQPSYNTPASDYSSSSPYRQTYIASTDYSNP